jgi:hypothetical protein
MLNVNGLKREIFDNNRNVLLISFHDDSSLGQKFSLPLRHLRSSRSTQIEFK